MTKEKLEQAQNILNDIEYLKNIRVSNGVSFNCCSKEPTKDATKEIVDFAFKIHDTRMNALNKAIKTKIADLEKQFAKL